jgi:sugar transferase (PEP-CTERM/EpsH1 system associated)
MITRVVHIVPDLVPYGLENMLAHLVCSMNRTRFQPTVISLYGPADGGLEPTLTAAGVKVFHLHKRRGFDGRMYHRLFRTFRQIRPHIVHSHNYVLRYSLPSALLAGVPAMAHTIHNVAHKEVDSVGRCIQRIAFRGLVHPVAIAQEVVTTYRQVYGSRKLTLIPNGIPVEVFSRAASNRESWREREGFSQSDLLYVCVARFFRQKNHVTLIEAFANGPARDRRSKLILAGDGDLRAHIEAQAQSLGIESQVRFLGRRSDIPDLLAAGDVFVLASLWEGNPLSVMEAMAAGRPVIATSVGGVPELLDHAVHGFLVPPGDAHALSKAMLYLMQNPGERLRMGRAAAIRAREKFDHRQMVKAYEALYETLLSKVTDHPYLREKAEIAV